MNLKISRSLKKTIVVPCYGDNNKINFFNNKVFSDKKNSVLKMLEDFNFEGKQNEIKYFKFENFKIILIGIKKDFSNEDIRVAYSTLFHFLKKMKEDDVLIRVPKEEFGVVKSVVEGLDLSDYKFDKYLSKKDEFDLKVNLDVDSKYGLLVKETLMINSCTKFTRNLVNENSNILVPKKFESLAREFAKKNNLKIEVLDEKKIISKKLNLLEAVGRASEHPPRLILIEYNGDKKSSEKTALVGKGITFDTGGVNLKPSGFLEDMKCDMGGAATVFGAFRACVELGLKKNLILVLSCAENAIGGSSFKAGDVFVSYSGKSVEIKNTDAEGRLILADALSYVQKNYSVNEIIDVATLTGACMVALGPSLIGSFGNDSKMSKKIFESGEKTYERVWNLPIYDEHRDMLKSSIADMSNLGGKIGGAISAAAFLEKYIEKDVKWAHLDIAGAAFFKKAQNYVPEYGTGIGVRLLVDYLKD